MNEHKQKYALLDYDGFVCKAFYASRSKKKEISGDPLKILFRLQKAAAEKAYHFFGERPKLILCLSDHSWKKQVEDWNYKASRTPNEELVQFRQTVVDIVRNISIINHLEADEQLIMMSDYLNHKYLPDVRCVVFSDDKDVKYYCDYICGININSQIKFNADYKSLFYQMLAGDAEDDIVGIPKVGMTTAKKLLDAKDEISLNSVIEIYRDKGISYQDCIKNLTLLIPMARKFVLDKDQYDDIAKRILTFNYEESMTDGLILDFMNFIENKVIGVYNNER